MATPRFETPPPELQYCLVSYPRPNIVLVQINRPKSLNCINNDGHAELDEFWTWMDQEPAITCGIITGGGRSFCAGQDLKEWNSATGKRPRGTMPNSGFAGISRRSGRKPIIAAVNGICFGGGCELIVNADLVVASRKATFALPEVKRGVVAFAGALPRIVRTIGRPRAMEMALTGRTVSAQEALEWGLVNRVVGDGDDEVVNAAIEYASMIAENSPDAVIVSREGIKLGWEGVGADEATRAANEVWFPRLADGYNMAEGLKAFVEKRKPVWKPAKL